MDRKSRLMFVLSSLTPLLYLGVGLVRGGSNAVGELWGLSLPFVFPFAVLALLASRDTYIPFAVLAVVQFPLYALAWYRLRLRGFSHAALWGFAAIHVAAAFITFVVFARSYGR